MTEGGVHVDDYENVDADLLDRFYGVHGSVRPQRPGEVGAGYTSEDEFDMDGADSTAEEDAAENEADENIYHDAVGVPDGVDPFPEADHRDAFWTTLGNVQADGLLPIGFNLLPHEHEEGMYPSVESIRMGQW